MHRVRSRELAQPVRIAKALILAAGDIVIRQQIDVTHSMQTLQESSGPLYVVPVIIDPRDDRKSNADCDLPACQGFEIFENQFVAHTRILHVDLWIHVLQIIQEEIGLAGNFKQDGLAGIPGGIDRTMDLQPSAGIQEFQQECRLHQRLPARKGDPTSRLVIKSDILLYLRHYLVDSHGPADDFPRIRRTDLDARKTEFA